MNFYHSDFPESSVFIPTTSSSMTSQISAPLLDTDRAVAGIYTSHITEVSHKLSVSYGVAVSKSSTL